MSTITDRIEVLISEAKRVSGDQGTYENHSPSELVAADEYIRNANATRSTTNMRKALKEVFRHKFSPPSARGS